MRRPIDSSAALRTWAWAPHSTGDLGRAQVVAGSVNAWRAMRRAVTPLQLSEAGAVDLVVTDHILPGCADIGHTGDGCLGDGTGEFGLIARSRAGPTRRSAHRIRSARRRVDAARLEDLLAQPDLPDLTAPWTPEDWRLSPKRWPPPFESAKAMAPGALPGQRAIGAATGSWAPSKTAVRNPARRGEQPPAEDLVQLLWVGEDGHHQDVGHREPTQPLLFVATQRRQSIRSRC